MRTYANSARRLAHLAAVAAFAGALAACGSESNTPPSGATAGSGPAGAVNVAGPDSGSSNVVTKSVPPTAQDSSVAVPSNAGTGDTNRSGMAVPPGGAPRDSN